MCEIGSKNYEEKMKMRQQELSRRWTRKGNTRPQSASATRLSRCGMKKVSGKGRPQSAVESPVNKNKRLDAMRKLYMRRPSFEKRLKAIPKVDMKTALSRAMALTSRAPMRNRMTKHSKKRSKKKRPKSAVPMERSSSSPKIFHSFMRTVSNVENSRTPIRQNKLPPRPTTAPATRRAYTPSNSHRFVDPKSPEKQPSSARNNKRSKPVRCRRPTSPTPLPPAVAESIYDKFVVKVPIEKRRSDPNRTNYMTGSPIKILPGVSPSKRSLMRVRAKLKAARHFAEAGEKHKLKRLSKGIASKIAETQLSPEASTMTELENEYLDEDDFEVGNSPTEDYGIRAIKKIMLPVG